MSQKAIREYDAKNLWYTHISEEYPGILIDSEEKYKNIKDVLQDSDIKRWVIKPDQLFGKREKHGLLGLNLDIQGVESRLNNHRKKSQTIDKKKGILDAFLIEPFIVHEKEYYIAIKTERSGDVLYFSEEGGVAIEDQRDTVKQIRVDVLENLKKSDIIDIFGLSEEYMIRFLFDVFAFFRKYGFVYLEVNPFVFHDEKIICLDMVVKVDTCATWQQKKSWEIFSRTKGFGSKMHSLETKVDRMDAETGASLKFSILNPLGRIGLVLGGGGASVITMDKLADMGLLDEVINYGELSGNPNYWHNKSYIQGLVDLMCEQKLEGNKKRRLCLVGGIANFTKIDVLCKAFIDALSERIEDIKKYNIMILVRRGGVNDVIGLELVEEFCKKNQLEYSVFDGDTYITDAIETIF